MAKKSKPKKKKAVKRKPAKKSTGLITVTSPVDPKAHIIIASEMADDNMIESELMGEVLPFFVYQFDDGGKKVSGLTVKGVAEVTRRLNRNKASGYKIVIDKESVKIDANAQQGEEKGVMVMLFAQNLISGDTSIGAKFEPFQKKGRNGLYTNTFALEKAISKAERNAKRKLIPEVVAVKMIENLIGEKKGEYVKTLPPPTTPKPQIIAGREMTVDEKFSKAKIMIQALRTKDAVMKAKAQVESSEIYSVEQKEKLLKALGDKILELSIK